ncbi:MAG: aminomethyl-transferring glycine dehydrogenase subunit GcvPA [Candidatus Eremiobacteraeota bacterium]|nr:aminomethyl-transferring glycine dehydrogenase subunit GcvPA [Candidatus Eremiobacteraeota bacterium]
MDIADASVYDGATALAEAAIMALGATGRKRILVSRAVHPNYRAVLQTYCDGLGVAVDEVGFTDDGTTDLEQLVEALSDGTYAAAALQSPNFFGNVDTFSPRALDAIRASQTIPIGVVAEALSLAVLAPPSSWGAQIVAGEAQSFGVAAAYGGPYVGFIAAAQEHMRRIPGRLVGKTTDAAGRTAYVLTLQAREQHIRRERATSNICTNQAHCALIATIYLALMGSSGLRNAAALNLARSRELASAVANVPGVRLKHSAPFFNEFVVDVGRPAREVLSELQSRGILGGLDLGRYYPELANCILTTATELTTADDIAALATSLAEVLRAPAAV